MLVPAGKADLALALQTAKGSPASSASFRSPLTRGLYLPRRWMQDDPATTVDALAYGAWIERIAAEGAPELVARPSMLGLLLYGALGAKAVSGSDPYTHTFTIGPSLPWLTAWSMLGDALFARIADTKVKVLTLSSRPQSVLTVALQLVGLAPTARTSPQAAALETTDAFVHADGAGALLVEGTAVARIEDISVQMTTGADLADTLVGPDIRDGRMKIQIQTVQTIADVGLWNRLHYGSATPSAGDAPTESILELGGSPAGIDFTWTRRTGRVLEIKAPRLVVADPIGGLEADAALRPVRATITYDAYRPASGSGFTALLTNGVAAY